MAKRRYRRRTRRSSPRSRGFSLPMLIGLALAGLGLFRYAQGKPLFPALPRAVNPADQYPTGPSGEGLYGIIRRPGVRNVQR